jgi:hypothetical protein
VPGVERFRVFVFWLLIYFCAAAESMASEPILRLDAHQAAGSMHSRDTKLLLTVTVSDPFSGNESTASKQAQHRENRVAAVEGRAPQSIAIAATKSFDLGSASDIANGLAFAIRSQSGENVSVQPKMLTVPNTKQPLEFSNDTARILTFIVNETQLSAVRDGTYTVTARVPYSCAVKQTSNQSSETHKDIVSNEAVVKMTSSLNNLSAPEQINNLYEAGRTELLCGECDKVMHYAEALEKLDPRSVGAQELRGDAFFCKGDLANARASFLRGVEFFRQTAADKKLTEPPEYLYSRISQIDRLLTEQTKKEKRR